MIRIIFLLTMFLISTSTVASTYILQTGERLLEKPLAAPYLNVVNKGRTISGRCSLEYQYQGFDKVKVTLIPANTVYKDNRIVISALIKPELQEADFLEETTVKIEEFGTVHCQGDSGTIEIHRQLFKKN